MSKLSIWMKQATFEEKKQLADITPTSLSMLYQLDRGVRSNGQPCVAGADLAGRLEEGVKKLAKKNEALPTVTRGDLCETCRKCKYFKGNSK